MSLVLEGLGYDVGAERHIDDVSLAFGRGTLNVLLGATLAGKTTLMRLMAGLDTPTRGRLLLDGQDVTGWPVRRRSVAMVYQQFINYPSLTVYENIASPLRVQRLARAEIEERVREAARLLKLEPYLERMPLALSGGQQQRTAIARALVKRADLVLLDEPLANLDYKLREELREELPRIFARSGAIFVYATTEPAEALLLGGQTATLFEGRLTQAGPTASVYRRPDDLVTARVFSDPPLNTLALAVNGGRASLPAGGVRVPAFDGLRDGDYVLGFRAHHLALAPGAGGLVPLAATVSVSEITGSESYVHLDVGSDRLIALVRGVERLDPGSAVTAHLDPTHAFLFAPDGRRLEPALAEAA